MSTIDTFLRSFARADWMDRAACRGAGPDLFFPDQGVDATAGKAVCATCPVATECGEHALQTSEIHGTWGGMSREDRKQVRIRRIADGTLTRPERPIQHGTTSGYERCRKVTGTACQPCLEALSRAAEYKTGRMRREDVA